MTENNQSNWHVMVHLDTEKFVGKTVRSIVIDKEKGVKAIYCADENTIVNYVFVRKRGWKEDEAKKFADEHFSQFKSFAHISVDQIPDFVKVVAEKKDGDVVDFPPNTPSFSFVEPVKETIPELNNAMESLATLLKGGSGSGNFGHAGRAGEVGGSSSDGGANNEATLGAPPLSSQARNETTKLANIRKSPREVKKFSASQQKEFELKVQTRVGGMPYYQAQSAHPSNPRYVDINNPKDEKQRQEIEAIRNDFIQEIISTGHASEIDRIQQGLRNTESFFKEVTGKTPEGNNELIQIKPREIVTPETHELTDRMKNIFVNGGLKDGDEKSSAEFKTLTQETMRQYPPHLQELIGRTLNDVSAQDLQKGNIGGHYVPPALIRQDDGSVAVRSVGSIAVNNKVDQKLSKIFSPDATLTHELAHALDESFRFTNEGKYGEDSNRFSKSRAWKDAMKAGQPITSYSRANVAENFAESVTAYVYAPKAMKEANAKAYDVIDKLWNNKIDALDIKKSLLTPEDNPVDDIEEGLNIIEDDFRGSIVEIITAEREASKKSFGTVEKIHAMVDDIFKGGAGSGNFGHAGRAGERGGSSSDGGTATADDDEIKPLDPKELNDSERKDFEILTPSAKEDYLLHRGAGMEHLTAFALAEPSVESGEHNDTQAIRAIIRSRLGHVASKMFFDKVELVKSLWAEIEKGGAGSGNFGHSGRIGEVGGSGGGGAVAEIQQQAVEPLPAGRKWVAHIEGTTHDTMATHTKQDGTFYQARLNKHETVYSKFYDHVKSVPKGIGDDGKPIQPIAVVMMDGPASGKSSMVKNLDDSGTFVRVDSDALRAHLPEYKNAIKGGAEDAAAITHKEASYMGQILKDRALESNKNIIFDGTGTNVEKYTNMIKDMKERGYVVHVIMPIITKEQSYSRSAVRAEQNGRKVPPHVIEEAFAGNRSEAFAKISSYADTAKIYDNTRPYDKTKPMGGATVAYFKDESGNETFPDKPFIERFRANAVVPTK